MWHEITSEFRCACGATGVPLPTGGVTARCDACGRTYRLRTVLELADVECPVCGWTGEVFAPGANSGRPNQICPQCSSIYRHRMIALYLYRSTTLLKEPATLLHFAPEPPLRRLFQRRSGLNYVTTDLTMPRVDIHTDITRLALASDSFDAILCSHVLEHIPDDRAAMRELFRVLKPGGVAIIVVPISWSRQTTYEDFSITDPAARREHFGQGDHVRRCGLDYGSRMMEAGFTVDPVIPVNTLSPELFRRHVLHREEMIFRCEKGTRNEELGTRE